MLFKDISFSSPLKNILCDEVLWSLAEQNQTDDILRLWESPQTFVVLGRASCLEDDIFVETIRRDGVEVLRRFSGGGTVIQGQGCLNFSLILSRARSWQLNDLRGSYRFILERVLKALRRAGIRGVFRPLADLATADAEKKFSGNAQHRGRHFILHHGTILYHFDVSLISHYLKMPRSTPMYRAGRVHEDFVTNVPVSAENLRQAFQEEFAPQLREDRLDAWEQAELEKRLRQDEAKVLIPLPEALDFVP